MIFKKVIRGLLDCKSLMQSVILIAVLALAGLLTPFEVFAQTGNTTFQLTDTYILVEQADDGGSDPAIFGTVNLRLLKGNTLVRQWSLFARSDAAGARVIAPQGTKVKLNEINSSFDIPDNEINSYIVALDFNLTDYDAVGSNDRLGASTVVANLSDFKTSAEISSVLTGEGKVKVAVRIARKSAPNPNARRFNEYTWLTSHNAFINFTDARWSVPNQSFGIIGQLDRGVRGLMLDTYSFSGTKSSGVCAISFGADCYDPGVYLCHENCSALAGATYALPRQNLKDVLDNIGDWLATNTQETDIVTIFFEDYTRNGQLASVIRNSKAAKYIFNPSGAWNVSVNGFPTISYMAQNNQRLLLFTNNGANADTSLGLSYDQTYNVENYWSIGAGGAAYECKTRWDGIPLNKTEDKFNRLFVMNHFRDVPYPATAQFDNKLSNLNDRLDKCKAAAGTYPNYLALDYFELGSGQNLVNTINQAWENAPIKKADAVLNFTGTWAGYFGDGTKSTYVWSIRQSGSSLTFTDVGGSNVKFSGRIESGKIIDSNNKTGTLSTDGRKITWSDGVMWIKQ